MFLEQAACISQTKNSIKKLFLSKTARALLSFTKEFNGNHECVKYTKQGGVGVISCFKHILSFCVIRIS